MFQQLARHDILGEIKLACGRCQGCRLRRASDWELRVTHEAATWRENCFLTLTYDERHLPPGGTLRHEDFQKFMKRLRKQATKTDPIGVRYYMCGEYGTEEGRPHYHVCLFNKDFNDRKLKGKSASGHLYYESAELNKLWPLGIATVQDLVPETASYATRYIMSKLMGDDADNYEWAGIEPEYNAMSLKPAIGAYWLEKYKADIYTHDYTIQRGKKRTPPKFYDQIMKGENPDLIAAIKETREARGAETLRDNTPDRLKVKETVLRAQMRAKQRNL